MKLRDEVIANVDTMCRVYRSHKQARIRRGNEYEPTFSGHLMDDPEGVGTVIAFDVAFVGEHMLAYENRQIPFLLDRVQAHGGYGFVLVYHYWFKRMWVVDEVRELVLGREVPLFGLNSRGKNCVLWPEAVNYDFLPPVLEHCKKRSDPLS